MKKEAPMLEGLINQASEAVDAFSLINRDGQNWASKQIQKVTDRIIARLGGPTAQLPSSVMSNFFRRCVVLLPLVTDIGFR